MKKTAVILLSVWMIIMLFVSVWHVSAASYIIGDVDNDGQVLIFDATQAQRVIARLETDTDGMYTKRGDVDGDGKLTSFDVTLIMRSKAHMAVPYPIGTTAEEPTVPATVAPTVKPTSKPDPYELPIVP